MAEQRSRDERFYYDPNNIEGLDLETWAKNLAYELLHKESGRKNSTYFHNSILSQHGRPVLAKATWGKFIQKVNQGIWFPSPKEFKTSGIIHSIKILKYQPNLINIRQKLRSRSD